MNRITAVVKMHLRDRLMWFILPWSILLSSFAVNLIISLFAGSDAGIYTGGIASIYIYMLVAGITAITQTFPFTLGLSVRRKDYFAGTLLMALLVCVFAAVMLYLLSFAERDWTNHWGVKLHFFSLPYFSDSASIKQPLIALALLLNMFFLGFVFSSVYRRFGKYGLYGVLTGVALMLTVLAYLCGYYELWDDIGRFVRDNSLFSLIMWTVPLTAIYAVISYGLLRRSTV